MQNLHLHFSSSLFIMESIHQTWICCVSMSRLCQQTHISSCEYTIYDSNVGLAVCRFLHFPSMKNEWTVCVSRYSAQSSYVVVFYLSSSFFFSLHSTAVVGCRWTPWNSDYVRVGWRSSFFVHSVSVWTITAFFRLYI